ncbi:MAG: cell division protein SepF [Propionibacterium sp.]|nr:MAG: cell division protein SepF [Propionibacterium sp.]
MAGAIRKAAAWFGLSDDGRYDDQYRAYGEPEENYLMAEPEEVQPSYSAVTQLPERRPAVRPVPDQPEPEPPATQNQNQNQQQLADISRIVSVRPRSYNEARVIGENFRDGIPVIMNLCDMAEGDDKRLVDFAAGLIFGLRGNIERVSNKVFLLCPHNLTVGPEDKERIASGGFFNQS